MFKRSVPPLAAALAAAAAFQLDIEEREEELAHRFGPAVSEMDRADREYRRAVETTLPRDSAAALLSAMAEFREQVHEIREQSRTQIAALYRRYNRSYGAFDPLDAVAPPATGLSHVDGTRAAGIADSARSAVDALRAQANGAILEQLQREQIDALIEAKRRRSSAFEAAVKHALEAAAIAPVQKTVYRLAELAEGWY